MRDRLPPLLLALLAVVVPVLLAVLLRHEQAPPVRPEKIVIVYPQEDESEQFIAAIRLALDQVNASGGIMGRPLLAEFVAEPAYGERTDLEDLVRAVLRQAQAIAADPAVIAVIGHGSSATAVPASAVYNRGRKLFLSTHATATSLTNHAFRHVFALQPSNQDVARVLASYAGLKGWRRVVALADGTNFAVEVMDRFRSYLTLDGGTVLFRTRQIGRAQTLENTLLFMLDNSLFRPAEIDAFFIASSSAHDYIRFIRRARALGLDMPILGPDNLYSREIELAVGAAMRDVVAFSSYDSSSSMAEAKAFHFAFVERFGREPGVLAALGHDAVRLLAFAANAAGSTDPGAIADKLRVLRYEHGFAGATGTLVFDASGLVTDTDTFVLRHDGTGFATDAIFPKPFEATGATRLGDDAMPRALIRENIR